MTSTDVPRTTSTASNPAVDLGYPGPPPRKGFFTDTTLCIGCKACEVACKEWNAVPEDGLAFSGMSYDNTQGLGASTWRHVAFIEQRKPLDGQEANVQHGGAVDLGMPSTTLPGRSADAAVATPFRWLMESDVCKHCTHAGCLDVCPTGALFRTEFGTVVVQNDICNGCGYCVPACPFGVIERREEPQDDVAVGLAQKCTLCYDRLKGDLEPACAKACPTKSIQFGDYDVLRQAAEGRVSELQAAGMTDARLYGHDTGDGVGGTGAFFLLLDEPEVYGLPPDPVVPTRDLPEMWRQAAFAALGLLGGAIAAFVGRGRR